MCLFEPFVMGAVGSTAPSCVHDLRGSLSSSFAGILTVTYSLPFIKTRVEERLREVEIQLSTLPEIPQNVEHEVRTSLSEFYRQIKMAVKEPVSAFY